MSRHKSRRSSVVKQANKPHATRLSKGDALLKHGKCLEAAAEYQKLIDENRADYQVYGRLSEAKYRLGDVQEAESLLAKALEIEPNYAEAHHGIAYLLHQRRQNQQALNHIQTACCLDSSKAEYLSLQGMVLVALHQHSEALSSYEKGLQISPSYASLWNNYGNALNDLGRIDESMAAYRKALELPNSSRLAFSNLLTTAHYHPGISEKDILGIIKQWDTRYAPSTGSRRPETDKISERKLKIGMISDGFRSHPVGQMIISALEECKNQQFELFFYSTNNHEDHITIRFKKVASIFVSVEYMSDEQLENRILEDKVDILFDLSGHNAGNRMLVVANAPSPIIVKWVGGLINTTGVSSIDYLISDSVETPLGVDENYTENIIRLPDDYICYTPPHYMPSVLSLPASKNNYITFGCFNNATKLNEKLLVQWSKLMRELPRSRLYLKSMQLGNPEMRERIINLMEAEGVSADRLRIEGPSPHIELLQCYNDVDISLDPWPYSGGLTTCESLLMGVPVVSFPGPTFAGRHSATHLINAGMPELVVNSWQEYRERVLELASDLDSLATIRQHLRQVLLESPVCNAPRFAKHFTNAMRAIWQRHCEGKQPAALTFDKTGQAQFVDEETPVDIVYAESMEPEVAGFKWSLSSKVIALDNGARLVVEKGIETLRQLNSFGIVAFDPASQVTNPERFEGSNDVQVFTHAVLGDGNQATLYSCLDPAMSSTLQPLPIGQQHGASPEGANVLAKLPINTIALDCIEGLESLDWLILDHLSDSTAILENGERALKDTLIIQVRIAFQPTHQRQPNLAEVQYWMSRHGFRFYRFNNEQHRSHLPESVPDKQRQATELHSANAIFLPNYERMAELSDNQRTKLAFLLHTVYGIKDMAYSVLAEVDLEAAEGYLVGEGLIALKQEPQIESITTSKDKAELPEETAEFPLPDAPHMSTAERKLFKKSLKKAKQYFEFGSGGSTVWAVKEGLTVQGVESDANWVNALKDKLGEQCQVEAVDIGATKAWGFPVSMDAADKFPAYSQAIAKYSQPFDFILVDGRFRVACTMSAILNILDYSDKASDARIFIHDFWNRPHYHLVLQFLEAVEKVETAGLFKISKNINREEVVSVWEQYAKQPQ
ncbi:tetratricopeptide repeat protein [Vreelandella venusta]|uniref:O-linked N-acetylglucosamine transferase, SPINDLY family protein n=1 Tax=Vreelandella venusta TaxID=44935 RepID=UPI003556C04C